MPSIISKAQDSFIPGRKIIDNITLCHELMKAYTKRITSPKCKIKIDLIQA